MDLSIVSEQKFFVLRGLGQHPNKHETGGFRVNGIRLFSQSGYRFALLAGFFLFISYDAKFLSRMREHLVVASYINTALR